MDSLSGLAMFRRDLYFSWPAGTDSAQGGKKNYQTADKAKIKPNGHTGDPVEDNSLLTIVKGQNPGGMLSSMKYERAGVRVQDH
jgi:hypothetical protein